MGTTGFRRAYVGHPDINDVVRGRQKLLDKDLSIGKTLPGCGSRASGDIDNACRDRSLLFLYR